MIGLIERQGPDYTCSEIYKVWVANIAFVEHTLAKTALCVSWLLGNEARRYKVSMTG
jgi:hypothetical protein